MSTMRCPICTSSSLTQEGLLTKQISRGYWLCLDCGNTVRPVIIPSAAEQGVQEASAEEST